MTTTGSDDSMSITSPTSSNDVVLPQIPPAFNSPSVPDTLLAAQTVRRSSPEIWAHRDVLDTILEKVYEICSNT